MPKVNIYNLGVQRTGDKFTKKQCELYLRGGECRHFATNSRKNIFDDTSCGP